IYRMPRNRSLITPPSACPACGVQIRFYDNIPLISWFVLGRKCRYCKAPISPRYFVIELLTGLVFVSVFVLYFRSDLRAGVAPFLQGGWFIYLVSIILLAGLIAVSAIDLELWVIPVAVCWLLTVLGLVSAMVGVYVIEPAAIQYYLLLPSASATTGSLSVGATVGLAISWLLLATGLIKRSYESEDMEDVQEPVPQPPGDEPGIDHREEICKEIFFLLPIFICSLAAYWIIKAVAPIQSFWQSFLQHPVIAGLLGSLWGYFVGCGIVWFTRIFGTLAFGKEAMGLGDVHLMGAAGAVIGASFVVVAFFIAPFFGLVWAGFQMFFKKTRQIPYGPFLSLGVFAVMILHDRILYFIISICGIEFRS
ncbi:MAG: prepilin peptidase, partial [Planctomycetota bacterium]